VSSKRIIKQSKKMTLDDIIDLTVVELYILNFLVRIGGTAVRFAVFNELNAQLEKSKISRSSFYNSLEKLKSKGFVVIKENPKGKGSTVKATPLAREAIRQNNIFSIWGNIDLQTITFEIIDKLSKKTDASVVNSQILVLCDELDNIETLNLLDKTADKTYILSDEESFDKYLRRGLEYPQSKFIDGIIREPDNFFDRGIISKYHASTEVFGLPAKELLKELVRIVKPGKYIVLTSFDAFPATNNMILDSIMGDLVLNTYFSPSTKKSLKRDFNEIGVTEVDFIVYKGYIVTIGKIPI
jgi:DNA-binding MarR family transcriptional regulator